MPLLAVLCLLAAVPACTSCPTPASEPAVRRGDVIEAGGSAGEVFVDADAERIALTRAARRVADLLGVDVEARLSVVASDGRLWVEAAGADGPTTALDELELVIRRRCDGRTHVRVRLPVTGEDA